MGTYQSPRDPVFWAHHNMIELCWIDWNLYRGNPNTNDASWMNWEFTEFFDRTGNPSKMTIGASMLLPLISYRYDADVAGAPKEAVGQEEHERLSKFVKEGAPARLEFESKFEISKETRLSVDKPEQFSIKVNPAVVRSVLENTGPRRLLLTVDGVTGPVSPDFYVRVFLGTKPPASFSIQDPGYAGSFAFFGDQHAGHAPAHRLKFVVDLSQAARRLQQQGALEANGAINVHMVPSPIEGKEIKSRDFSLGRLELGILK